ncbi:MAG: hypothetical protein ACRDL6_11485 [Solirubrobacterales bacterium]
MEASERSPLRPRDWLLLLIALPGAPQGLDPVRLQKGAFLLAREAGLSPSEAYSFEPYNYGPMSRPLYGDVERLCREGLAERRPVEGYSWGRLKPTERGRDRARGFGARADPSTLAHLRRIKHRISAMTFAELLDDLYERYPEYATRSVFRRP